jgi:FMN phosphatase YigB (HAD superfamily)
MTRPTASYDVFDTIVTRAFAHPRDLYVQLGVVLQTEGLSDLAPFEFARRRWAAELGARDKSPDREFVLDDIYRELGALTGWDAAILQTVRIRELDLESKHLRGVPLVRPRLEADRTTCGRLIFLSDMYLPSAVLRPWLEREGAVHPGDLLLISGEVRGNKSSGALFAAARQANGGDFARWHHMGDHPVADVGSPRSLGIEATHFTAVHLTPGEKLARDSAGEFATPWRSLLAGAMRLARLDHIPATERESILWETGATVAGPLFHGFVRWTLAEARRRGLRRLYFLARDGQIFWRIAREIEASETNPIDCRYLAASRLVFAGPAEQLSSASLREMAMPNAHFHSLRQALLVLGLDDTWAEKKLPPEFAALDPGANLDRAIRARLADWLLAPERAADVRAGIGRRAATARAYLKSVGFGDGTPAGLVDAGWYGTIQRNLEYILGDAGAPIPLTGFYLGLRPQLAPAAGTLLGYTNVHAPLPLMTAPSHRVLVELLAQGDHGQVVDFVERDGQLAPVLHKIGPVNVNEIRLVQEAVLAFTRRQLETAATAAAPEGEFARTVIGLYRRFHDHPSRREAELFGFLPHADQAFEQQHATLCARFGWMEILAALVDYRRRPPQWWIQGQAALGAAPLLRTFSWLKRTRRALGGGTP